MCALFAKDVFVIDLDVMHRGYDRMIITGDDIVLAGRFNGEDVLNRQTNKWGQQTVKSILLPSVGVIILFDLQKYNGNTVPIPGGQRFS